MSLLSKQPTNSTLSSKLMGYAVTTSLYNRPIAVPFGMVRVSGNVIWTGGWDAQAVNGGKGNKGKGGSQQYDYITNLLLALGAGPVNGVFSIWRDKDLFNLAYVGGPYGAPPEKYTVPVGGGTYKTLQGGTGNPNWWVANIGVAREDTYSYTATDYGSPASASASGMTLTPMQLVASSPQAGQYTLSGVAGYNPGGSADGYARYTFSAADAGKTMEISYSWQLNNYSTMGSPLTHLNLLLFNGIQGQQPWTYIEIGWPTQALGYSQTALIGSGAFDLGSAGVVPNLNFEILGRCTWGGGVVDCNPADMISDILTNPLDGVLGWTQQTTTPTYGAQPVFGTCTINGKAMVVLTGSLSALSPGQQITINNLSTTIQSIADSTHATLSEALSFTINVGALGITIPFIPGATALSWSATVTESYSKTVGTCPWLPVGTAANGIGPGSQVYKYCAANGIFLSKFYDQQTETRQVINELLEQANSDAFWSEGVLKFGCYGDTTAAGNGFQYSPATQPIYNIDDTCMICGPGEEPLKQKRPDIRDVKNEVSVEWTNRSAGYAINALPPAQDASMVAKYGRRPDGSKSYHGIMSQIVASLVQNTGLKRVVYIDGAGSYELTLPQHFALLDPMDLITVTDVYQGFNKKPLRITRIEEDDKLCLKITLEEFPWSCSAPTLYPSQPHTPTQVGYYAPPGMVNTPMFVQIPEELAGNSQTVGIALSGAQNWGGAAVYVSTDGGNSYEPAGMFTGGSTMGYLTAALAASADPDTTSNALQVSLTESYGELDSFTQTQADELVPLIAVESEILSYETATLTGTYQYDLTYLRRGVYETTNCAHPVNAPFCVLDGLFEYEYPDSAIGKTLWFKFCSINQAGQQQQDISQVTAYSYFVPTPRAPWPLNAGFETPTSGDPLFTAQNIGVELSYQQAQNGGPIPQLTVLAEPPLSQFSTAISAPVITSITVATTGGSIGGGETLIVAVDAFDTPYAGSASVFDSTYTGNSTRLSNRVSVTVPAGTSTNELSITVDWPTGSYGGAVFVATGSEANGFHREAFLRLGGTATSGLLTDTLATVAGSAVGPPDDQFDHVVINVSRVLVSGLWNQTTASVTTNLLSFGQGSGGSANDSVGLIISKTANAQANATARLPIQDFVVTANDTAGNYSVTPDPVAAGCVAGDTFTLRTGGPGSIPSGSQASSTATSYTNPLWVNCYNNGMTLHKNSGNLAFVVGGTGAGQPPVTLNDNTATGFTCSPWTIQPDKTSVIELVEANPQVTSIGKPLPLANYANWQGVLGSVGVPNYFGQVVRVEVYTADSDGNMGPQQTVAFRDIYVEGSQGTRIVTASTTQISTDAWILCQATSAITVQILPAAQWLNGAMGVENDSPNSSTVTVQFAVDNGVAETDNNGNTSVTLAAGQVWSGRGHA